VANPTPALQPAASGPTSPHAITTKPVTVHTGWIVQVGALESEDNAQKLIESARNSAHGLLTKADPFTEPMTANDGRKLYRARFAGLERDQAEAVCQTLRRSDIACIIVRG
jgi:D-alanyl-D-alanine carboxypeptidase